MPEAIRIAVIDDHPIFRGGLQRAFSLAPDVKLVAEGASAADASLIAKEQQPDVMLLDVTMPGGGIEAARAIVASGSSVKTIMLTGSDDDEYVAAALAAGAQGYLLKGANAAELLEAVRTVHSGRPYVTPALSSSLLVRAARTQHLAGDAAIKSSRPQPSRAANPRVCGPRTEQQRNCRQARSRCAHDQELHVAHFSENAGA